MAENQEYKKKTPEIFWAYLVRLRLVLVWTQMVEYLRSDVSI